MVPLQVGGCHSTEEATHSPDFLRQLSVVQKYGLLSYQHVKSLWGDQESAANCLFHYTWLVTTRTRARNFKSLTPA